MALPKVKKGTGFTLVELMIVVAIIGIIAGIAIPRYISFIQRSKEANTKGNLGVLRSAISIYYADAEHFPLAVSFDPRPGNENHVYSDDGFCWAIQNDFKAYMDEIPSCAIGPNPSFVDNPNRSDVWHQGLHWSTKTPEPDSAAVGWWYYRSTETVSGLASVGRMYINVLGSDRKGEYYTSW